MDVGLVLYVAWLCHAFSVRGPAFARVLGDFNTEVPAVTSLVVRVCTAPTLYVLGGIVSLLLIAKNRFVASDIPRFGMSFCVLLLVLLGTAVVNEAMFQPMLRLFTAVGR